MEIEIKVSFGCRSALMELLPDEMLGEIISKVSRGTLVQVHLVSKTWDRWAKKCPLEIITEVEFFNVCRMGNLPALIRSRNQFKDKWARGIYLASRNNHRKLVEWMRDSNHNINIVGVFAGACRENHRVLIVHLMLQGFNDVEWEIGLWHACAGGHHDLAEWLLQEGATDVDGAFGTAAKHGRVDTMKWLLTKGATNWFSAIHGACRGNHFEIIRWLTEDPPPEIEWHDSFMNAGLQCACGARNNRLVKYFIEKGATQCNFCLTDH